MSLKPYWSKKLMLLDLFLFLLTGGGWLLVIIIRELYRMNKRR